MHVAAYSFLYNAYKYVMTLSCTQVYCENLFSQLNIVKKRLRSTISQPIAIVIDNFKRRENFPLDYEQVIDQFAVSAPEKSSYA